MPRISEGTRLERRQLLVEGAWRCAGRMGYSELTVDDICAEAEVSKAAFYGYFASEQELLITLFEEDAADLDGRLMLNGWVEGAVADGEIADIPANAFASVLLALGDGLTLHGSLDPSGFRRDNIDHVLAAIFAGLSGDEE